MSKISFKFPGGKRVNTGPARGGSMMITRILIDPSYTFNNALDKYPTLHHSVTELCTHVHPCAYFYYRMVHCWIWDCCIMVYGIFATGPLHDVILSQTSNKCCWWWPGDYLTEKKINFNLSTLSLHFSGGWADVRLISFVTLHWRHNGRDSVSNHQPHDWLLNRLFRRRSKKTSKLRVTGLCVGNSQGDRWIPRTNGQ